MSFVTNKNRINKSKVKVKNTEEAIWECITGLLHCFKSRINIHLAVQTNFFLVKRPTLETMICGISRTNVVALKKSLVIHFYNQFFRKNCKKLQKKTFFSFLIPKNCFYSNNTLLILWFLDLATSVYNYNNNTFWFSEFEPLRGWYFWICLYNYWQT